MWIFSSGASLVSILVLAACAYLVEAGGALAVLGVLLAIPFGAIFLVGLVIGVVEWLGRLSRDGRRRP